MMDQAGEMYRIIEGDCRAVLGAFPPACVDVVFADPPYNLQLNQELWRPNLTLVDAVNNDWDRFADFAAYDAFTREWLAAVRRVMKPSATIWVSGTYHNIFRVGAIMQDLGFWILNTVTWFKPNAMPNFRGTRLKNDVEFVIWAQHTAKAPYTFNHHAMKRFNTGKQLGSVWSIPVCGGAERLRDETGHKLHPTQKPEELLSRILLASSQPGDLVLDPFLGSGTTAVISKRLRRQVVGIERDPVYVAAARARLAAVEPLPLDDALLRPPTRQRLMRVPFLELLRRGLLRPGQVLTLGQTGQQAVILDDGRLSADGLTGSIHRLGAQLKRVPSCNGWMLWHYHDPQTGQLRPINVLRDAIRQTLDHPQED